MKKYIFKTIILIICIIGASEAVAQFSNAPSSNTEIPINTSSAAQIKTGDISVNTFTVSKSAQFEKGVILQGILLGNSTGANTSTLKIGGLDPANIQRIVDVLVPNGKIAASNTVTLASLIGSQPTNKELCATNTGTVVFCGDATVSTSTAYCGNGAIEGAEDCDDGDLNGTSGSSCSLTCQTYTPAPTGNRIPVQIYSTPTTGVMYAGIISPTDDECTNGSSYTGYIDSSYSSALLSPSQTGLAGAFLYTTATGNNFFYPSDFVMCSQTIGGVNSTGTNEVNCQETFAVQVYSTAGPSGVQQGAVFGYSPWYGYTYYGSVQGQSARLSNSKIGNCQ